MIALEMSTKFGNTTKNGDRMNGQELMDAFNMISQYIGFSEAIDKLLRSQLVTMLRVGDSIHIVVNSTNETYILKKTR